MEDRKQQRNQTEEHRERVISKNGKMLQELWDNSK